MKILVQRVKNAKIEVKGKIVSQINQGYLLLIGIDQFDNEAVIKKMAAKTLKLRVMADQNNKMNINITDSEGEILAVSQFTLSGDASQNRPSFIKAAEPEKAKKLFDFFVNELKQKVEKVKTGIFGQYMQVYIQNDGPVTIWLDSEEIIQKSKY